MDVHNIENSLKVTKNSTNKLVLLEAFVTNRLQMLHYEALVSLFNRQT